MALVALPMYPCSAVCGQQEAVTDDLGEWSKQHKPRPLEHTSTFPQSELPDWWRSRPEKSTYEKKPITYNIPCVVTALKYCG